MNRIWTAALFAAGLAAFGPQAGAAELRVPVSLTSFGAAQALSSYQMSAAGLAMGPAQTFSRSEFSRTPVYGGATFLQSFAASSAFNENFALDSGYNLDLAQRFDNYTGAKSPLLGPAGTLGLANGGHYAGITYVPSPSLRVRVGAQFKNDRLDSFTFDPVQGVPLTYETGEQRSLLAGASWNLLDWAGLSVSGIINTQKGQGFVSLSRTARAGRATTAGLNVSAQMSLGAGWVTTAAFSEGLSQLDQKIGAAQTVESHSYSIAIAKHGLFGADALGFSFSRPSPSLLESGFEMVAASGDLPPAFAVGGRLPGGTPETDLQLGYVTSFLDGALALQANAAYQMNYQGQTGATSLAVLSRAKIKF